MRDVACTVATVAAVALLGAAPAGATVGATSWGYNAYGELGNGSTTKSTVPVAVTGLTGRIAGISAGATHAVALSKDGTAVAWGANEYGQDGDGTSTGPEGCSFEEPCSKLPVAVEGLTGATAVAAGGAHTLALLGDGSVMAWGANGTGQLGIGTHTGPATCSRFPFEEACSTTPVAVSGLSGVTAVAAGARHSLALLSDGTVVAWGNNESGELGDATTEEKDAPVVVSGLSGVAAIAAGGDHSFALLSNGAVKAWGSNYAGALGDGTTTDRDVPVTVSGLSGVSAISAGGYHSLALLGDGTVRAWGLNGNGQLGNGSVTSSSLPVEVTGVSEASGIAAGLAHSLALKSDGTAMAWGWNNEGQIGDGAIGETQPTAVPVTSLSGATMVSAGAYYSLAYSPPPPTVTAVSPAEGVQAGGTSVSITGTEFTGTTAVKFGSSEAKSFTVNSDTSITAVSAAGSGTVDVTVTNAVGTSATSASDQFTYVHTPAEDLPELGRCVKLAGKGAFTRRSCVPESATHTGNYEWIPGPGPKPRFTITAGATTLETVKARISCASGHFTGEFTGTKTETLNVTFSGCHDGASVPCQTSPTAAAGEISTTQALEGEVGFIRAGSRPKVGVDLRPKSPATTILSFECREGVEAGTHVLVEGSVIGQDKTLNHMASTFKLLYKASGTRQIPDKFETGVKDTLTAAFLPSAAEAAGLTMLGAGVKYITGATEEPLEVKAKL